MQFSLSARPARRVELEAMRRRLIQFPVFETVFAAALLLVLLPISILSAILAVTFVALCIWLTVRVMNRRERWARRVLLVVVGLPALYLASLGPACWISSRANVGQRDVALLYSPMTWMFGNSKSPFTGFAILYAEAGAADDWHWRVMPRTGFGISWAWHHDEPEDDEPPGLP